MRKLDGRTAVGYIVAQLRSCADLGPLGRMVDLLGRPDAGHAGRHPRLRLPREAHRSREALSLRERSSTVVPPDGRHDIAAPRAERGTHRLGQSRSLHPRAGLKTSARSRCRCARRHSSVSTLNRVATILPRPGRLPADLRERPGNILGVQVDDRWRLAARSLTSSPS